VRPVCSMKMLVSKATTAGLVTGFPVTVSPVGFLLFYEIHIFVCPQYEPLKGAYTMTFNSRAYRQVHSAMQTTEVDTLF
jgi:hypothetical protein